MLESQLLCPSKRDENEIESFAGKASWSILQSDQILSLCLECNITRVAVIAKVTIKIINYSRMGSILCNGPDIPAVICLK